MVPDDAPDDGVQPEPQFVPPHVRVATAGALYLPALQSVQTVEAVPAAYLPPPHSAQVEAAAAPENLPASQLVQTVEAVPAEYFPTSHSRHAKAEVALESAEYLPV